MGGYAGRVRALTRLGSVPLRLLHVGVELFDEIFDRGRISLINCGGSQIVTLLAFLPPHDAPFLLLTSYYS